MQVTPWGAIPTQVNRKRFRKTLESFIPESQLWSLPDEERKLFIVNAWRKYLDNTIDICDELAEKLKNTAVMIKSLAHASRDQEEIPFEIQSEAKRLARSAINYYSRMIQEGCITAKAYGGSTIPPSIRDIARRGLLNPWSVNGFKEDVSRIVISWETNKSIFKRLYNRATADAERLKHLIKVRGLRKLDAFTEEEEEELEEEELEEESPEIEPLI